MYQKGVAVPYIIAIVLGIIVIGLLGYWLISQSGRTIGGGAQGECEALCAGWRASAFNVKPIDFDRKCPDLVASSLAHPATNCMVNLNCVFAETCSPERINYGFNVQANNNVCCAG